MLLMFPKPDPGKGALYGHQWEPRQLAAWNYAAGWNDVFELTVSVMVELAESQGFDHAIHVNPDGSEDWGIWQLDSGHKDITEEIAYDPVKATTKAFNLYVSRGSSFEDWVAYNTGVYLHDTYLGKAARGVGNFVSEELLKVEVPNYEHKFVSPILNFEHRLAGMKNHVTRSKQILGFGAKSKDIVLAVQEELSAALQAAIPVVPPK